MASADRDDANAYLAAGLIATTWTIAFLQAHALLGRAADADEAQQVFLYLVHRGATGTLIALVGTPYA